MIETAEPKLFSAGACCAARRYDDELARGQVLADLVLRAGRELLDALCGGGHGSTTFDT
jgi:hypothetical protein